MQLSVTADHVTLFSNLNSSCTVSMHTFPIQETRDIKTNIKLDLRNDACSEKYFSLNSINLKKKEFRHLDVEL